MRSTKIVFALLLAAGLLASGCGGGGSSNDGDAPQLSEAAFVKQGNAICAHAKRKLESEGTAIAREIEGSNKEEVASIASDFLAPSVEEMAAELSALGVPRSDAKRTQQMIASYHAALVKLEEKPEAAVGSDPFTSANKSAIALGLSSCVI